MLVAPPVAYLPFPIQTHLTEVFLLATAPKRSELLLAQCFPGTEVESIHVRGEEQWEEGWCQADAGTACSTGKQTVSQAGRGFMEPLVSRPLRELSSFQLE